MSNEREFAGSDFIQHDVNYASAGDAPQTGVWAALLAPRTLQILMLSGGCLLVLGLVIWLWSQGVFENSLLTACTLGVANLSVLAIGTAGVRHSRYQTAGMALTILACLVLPLNLWFYDTQGLVTLDQGGHLWVAALVCCSLYVAVAGVLASPVFVYPIVGGVALTGLLFLADQQVARFWEITSPSALLMVIGMISIHAERLFPVYAGPFARDKFGRAFFHAGHAALAVGMAILISGHIVGWVYEPLFAEFNWFPRPAVATQTSLKIVALGLSLAAAYSYLYSQIVVAERGRYAASALATLVWCGLILMDLLAIPFTMEVAALIASCAALLAGLPSLMMADNDSSGSAAHRIVGRFGSQGGLQSLSSVLSYVALCLVLCLYIRARFEFLHLISPYQFSGVFVAASLLAAAGTYLSSRRLTGLASQGHLSAMAVLVVLSIAGVLGASGYKFGPYTLVGEMIVPLAIVAIALTPKQLRKRIEWTSAAASSAAILLFVGWGVTVGAVSVEPTEWHHWWLVVFFAEAALCFGLSTAAWFRASTALCAAISVCGFTWQLLLAVGITQYVFLYSILLVGIIAIATNRFLPVPSPLTTICQWTGRACLTYGGVAALLLAGARLLTGECQWAVVGLLAAYFIAAGFTAWTSPDATWRKHFTVVAVLELVLMLLSIGSLSALHFVERLELLVTAAGAFSLTAGLVGWRREGERRDSLVSCNLALGSVLSCVPMMLGLIGQRLGFGWHEWGWVMFHELGVLMLGLLLLGVGVLCRIRWTTLSGATTLAVYVLSLVLLVRLPEQLQTTAIYMMTGGGLFFAVAVLLSIYRDRLLALPRKVKAGEGVFEVLTWR